MAPSWLYADLVQARVHTQNAFTLDGLLANCHPAERDVVAATALRVDSCCRIQAPLNCAERALFPQLACPMSKAMGCTARLVRSVTTVDIFTI
jgi:hypothetical protein